MEKPEHSERLLRNVNLETKVIVITIIIQVILWAFVGVLYVRFERNDYLSLLHWRTRAIVTPLANRVKDLSSYPPDMQRTLGLNVDCTDLLNEYVDTGLQAVGVIDKEGHVVAHTDQSLIGSRRYSTLLQTQQDQQSPASYHTPDDHTILIPVLTQSRTPISFLEMDFSPDGLSQRIQEAVVLTLTSFTVLTLLSAVLTVLLFRRLVRAPIRELCTAAEQLAAEQYDAKLPVPGTDEIGILSRSFLTMRDAIRRRIMEVRSGEERFRNIFNSTRDAIFIHDRRGKILDVNQAMLDMYEVEKEFALSQMITTDYSAPENDIPSLEKFWSQVVQGQTVEFEWIARRPVSGHTFPVHVLLQPVTLGGDHYILAVVRDETKAKDEEQKRLQLEDQLRQSQKLDAIGQLAGGIAHDFNNMLAGILGSVDLLEYDIPDKPMPKKFLSIIRESSQRAAGLTDKLLSFSRRTAVKQESFDIHKVVTETVELLKQTIDRRIKIQTQLSCRTSCVLGDESQLHSVILNLGINASHAMENGGELHINSRSISLSPEECKYSPAGLEPGDYIELEVSDTGKGIAPDDLPRIFEPFFTTKERGKGTGLGLAAAYGIIGKHNGEITVTSELGKGTVFRIILPLHKQNITTNSAEEDIVHGEGLILVVDDEEALRVTTEQMLTEWGYNVIVGKNGQEALDLARRRIDEIDLVLLDMIMPEMNGRDCFEQLRLLRKDLPVVFVSGYVEDNDMEKITELGISGFIQKPCDSAELSRIVARAIQSD